MKTGRQIVFAVAALTIIFAAGGVFAADTDSDEESAKFFQLLDKNKDGRISRGEWNAIDTDKDGTVTSDELERYHFKSSRTYRWIDTNNDGHMDRQEFQDSFKR